MPARLRPSAHRRANTIPQPLSPLSHPARLPGPMHVKPSSPPTFPTFCSPTRAGPTCQFSSRRPCPYLRRQTCPPQCSPARVTPCQPRPDFPALPATTPHTSFPPRPDSSSQTTRVPAHLRLASPPLPRARLPHAALPPADWPTAPLDLATVIPDWPSPLLRLPPRPSADHPCLFGAAHNSTDSPRLPLARPALPGSSRPRLAFTSPVHARQPAPFPTTRPGPAQHNARRAPARRSAPARFCTPRTQCRLACPAPSQRGPARPRLPGPARLLLLLGPDCPERTLT